MTYGGLVYQEQTKLSDVLAIFQSVLFFLKRNAIEKLHLKIIPFIYHTKPGQEIEYALFLAEAQLVRRDSLSVIDLSKEYNFSKIRKRGIQKGIANGLVIKEETSFESFWNDVLIPNLDERHGVKPIHSVKEINGLKNIFPSGYLLCSGCC